MIRPHALIRTAAIALLLVWICGCAYIPPSNNKAKWYATIENISGKIVVLINANEWLPLLGPDGHGGFRRVMLYFADLDGVGPVYPDPVFGKASAPELKSRHLGSIIVDAKHKQVVIDLQQTLPQSGDPLKTVPCPANGTYPLRHWKDRLSPR